MNARTTVLALSLATALSACAVGNQDIQFGGVCALPDECGAFSSKCDALYLGEYVMDGSNANQTLIMYIQVNNMREAGALTSANVDTSRAYVNAVEIRYFNGPAAVDGITFGVTSDPVEPGGTTVMRLPVVPIGRVGQFGTFGRYMAGVKLHGNFASGDAFVTDEFQIVFHSCNACDATLPSCPVSTPTVTAVCPQLGQTMLTVCE